MPVRLDQKQYSTAAQTNHIISSLLTSRAEYIQFNKPWTRS